MQTLPFTLRIPIEESLRFARLSGDYNPLHLNAEMARRMRFGTTVVHGMHTCLAVLEQWLANNPQPIALSSIQVQFFRPVPSGASMVVNLDEATDHRLRWTLRAEGRKSGRMQVSWVDRPSQEDDSRIAAPEAPFPDICQVRTLEQVRDLSGQSRAVLDRHLLAALFPALERGLHAQALAVLLAATRLIGMECPGRDALFAGFSIRFDHAWPGDSALRYRIIQVDERIDRVVVALSGSGAEGELEAFFCPPPVRQSGMEEIHDQLRGRSWGAMRALIVGGSRGLGELTAKLIAAGGGEVAISHCLGYRDARRVQEEIRAWGGSCTLFAHDVLNPDAGDPFPMADSATHLFYFASPRIQLDPWGGWKPELFQTYCRYYVTGFLETVKRMARTGPHPTPLKIFYPSTLFLDRPEAGAAEYAAAKAAGEAVCHHLKHQYPYMTCDAARLDRTLTDQTASMPHLTTDPLRLMMERMQRLTD
ncbi:MAG: hypothetical protein HQM00_10270 [Magnetococcales bacterium]|nr:hypothetical protein [Magnetococcales bacterium]